MISGLPGTLAYLDDVIVIGRSADEHQRNLEALFSRLATFGFRVRVEKCKFAVPQIRYLGCIVDRDGRRLDPERTKAIVEMLAPTNVSTLRSFLGLINFYSNFIHKMSDIRAPFDKLLRKDEKFLWSKECQAVFEKVKKILQSNLLLTIFDPRFWIIVVADTFNYGIGAIISHRLSDGSE